MTEEEIRYLRSQDILTIASRAGITQEKLRASFIQESVRFSTSGQHDHMRLIGECQNLFIAQRLMIWKLTAMLKDRGYDIESEISKIVDESQVSLFDILYSDSGVPGVDGVMEHMGETIPVLDVGNPGSAPLAAMLSSLIQELAGTTSPGSCPCTTCVARRAKEQKPDGT